MRRASLAACIASTCGLLAGPAHAADDPPTPQILQLDRIKAEVTAGRIGNATVLCEEGRAASNTSEYKTVCGAAYVALGDKLWASDLKALARKRWEEAATWDARLIDDPDFVARLAGHPSSTQAQTPTVLVKPGPATPTKPADTAIAPQAPARKRAPADAGPRWDLGLGLGLDLGYDGLAALVVGWLTDEQFLLELAVGAAYPTVDLRFRWLGLRRCLSPVVGFGMLVPFAKSDRLGLDLRSYESLYELGEAFHFDIGAAWTPVYGLNLFAGVAFVTPLDQQHPDTVVLFPQLAGSVSWYF